MLAQFRLVNVMLKDNFATTSTLRTVFLTTKHPHTANPYKMCDTNKESYSMLPATMEKGIPRRAYRDALRHGVKPSDTKHEMPI